MKWLERFSGIEEFLGVAEHGSFVNAADKLGLTPSAVGKAVQRLEARLRVRLLTRTTRRVALTEDGALFRERWQALLRDMDQADGEIDARRSEIAGLVRLSAPVGYGRLKVVAPLAAFMQAHPGLQLDLRLSDKLVDPIEERIDLVVRIGALEDSSMWARQIDQIHFGAFASPAYLARQPAIEKPQDVATHARLGFVLQSGKALTYKLQAEGGAIQFAPTPEFICNDIEGALAAAEAGLGLVYLPLFIAQPALQQGSLVQVLPDSQVDGPPVHLLHPQPRQMPRRVRALAEHLVAAIRGPSTAALRG
jgi:DNA-binding transcriptional LysR family regulator